MRLDLWGRRSGSRTGRGTERGSELAYTSPMKCRHALAYSLIALLGTAAYGPAQVTNGSAPTKSEVGIAKLSEPVYPRLAQQARITGDVDLKIRIRPDGTVEAAEVISGHPMLREAALDSARQSRFDCRFCSDGTTEYSLTYRFEIAPREPQKACDDVRAPSPPAEIDKTKHLITVSAWELWICDPACTITRFRSAKCLYLWKCSQRCD